MKRRFTILSAALALLVSLAIPMGVWGQTRTETTTTYTFSSKAWTASPVNWTSGQDGAGFTNGQGVQITAAATGANATSPISFTDVSQIVVTYCTNSKAGAGAIKIKVGNGTEKSFTVTKPSSGGTTLKTTTFSYDPKENGNVKVTVDCTANSIYIYSVAIKTITNTSTPTMSVSPSSIDFGSNAINPANPYTETFEVTFANLTENLTVTGFSGVTVSPATINANATSPQTVTVSYNPTVAESISGNISVNSSEVDEQLVAVSGSAYDPANVDTYELYTGEIVEGDYVIYNTHGAMKNELNGGPRFNNESVTISGDDNDEIINPANSVIWHIAPIENTEYWTIYNADINKYAGGTTSKNQGALYDDYTDNHAKWKIYYSYSTLYIENLGRSQDASDSGNKYLRQNTTASAGWATYANSGSYVPKLYKKVITNQVAAPTFSVASGTYYETKTVELSCETSGATIYYTTDGTTPSASNGIEYTTSIIVSSTVTIKAIAVKEGMTDSDVATAEYTIEQPYSTIPALFAAATATEQDVRVTFGNWVVSGVSTNGKSVYVTDNSGNGFLIYFSADMSNTFSAGKILSGTAVSCKLKLYNGAAELVNLNASDLTITDGGNVSIVDIAMASLSGVNTGALVHYDNLTCSLDNNKYYLSDGTTTLQAYNTLYAFDEFEDGKTYNVTGLYVQYNNIKEIAPRSADDIEEVVVTTPIINADDVNIAYDATSGEIAYTIINPVDGQNPIATTTADWISNINVGSESVTFTTTANEGDTDRSATITLSYTGATDKVITVTQGHYVVDYAVLPFVWGGGSSSDFLDLNGVTAHNLGTDYASGNSPYLIKLDNTGDYIQVKTNEQPGKVTIGVKMIGGASTSTITIQGSADGETFTNIETLTISGAQNNVLTLETTNAFAANVRYVRMLFTKGSNVGVGPITITKGYTKTINGYGTNQNGGYELIASPIGTISNSDLEENVINIFSSSYDLYYFDQSNKNEEGNYLEWVNYRKANGEANTNFDLVRGKGYLYANSQTIDLVFTGVAPSTDDFSVTLAYDADARFAGWNLVGNPYAVTAYFTTDRDFYTMNSAGTSFEVCTDPEGSIQPMQGVFVIAKNEETLTFTTTQPTEQNRGIVLKLSEGRSNTDAAIVRFGEGRTLPKLQLFEGSTKIYIPQDGQDFAVVRSEEMGEMPVNFKAESNGTYSLNISGQNTEFAYLHLIDNMTGNDVDLLQTPSYSFEAKTTDYESRFKLVFATGDNSNDDNFAFYSNGSFVINNEGNAELQVIDLMGRIVKSESINGCANVSVNGAAGVYMLRLVNGDNVKVQKVVVK